MNKLFAAILVVVFAVGLVGCGDNSRNDGPQKGSMGKATPGKNW